MPRMPYTCYGIAITFSRAERADHSLLQYNAVVGARSMFEHNSHGRELLPLPSIHISHECTVNYSVSRAIHLILYLVREMDAAAVRLDVAELSTSKMTIFADSQAKQG